MTEADAGHGWPGEAEAALIDALVGAGRNRSGGDAASWVARAAVKRWREHQRRPRLDDLRLMAAEIDRIGGPVGLAVVLNDQRKLSGRGAMTRAGAIHDVAGRLAAAGLRRSSDLEERLDGHATECRRVFTATPGVGDAVWQRFLECLGLET